MTEIADEAPVIALKDFFEQTPPGAAVEIVDFLEVRTSGKHVKLPTIQLHCSHEGCGGQRYFRPQSSVQLYNDPPFNRFVTYVCQNCNDTEKIYSFRAEYLNDKNAWLVRKFGEILNFGSPVPPRAIKLIGPDRELFLQGRRCENQGLGIGAFTYYRRVIENQRNRIFDEIIRVLNSVSPSDPLLAELEAAKQQRQFTTSVEALKHALPSSLLVNGSNPLLLLHSALSEGVHDLTDEDCLELAGAVRTVLFQFSDRLAQALKDDQEIVQAVALLSKKNKPSR